MVLEIAELSDNLNGIIEYFNETHLTISFLQWNQEMKGFAPPARYSHYMLFCLVRLLEWQLTTFDICKIRKGLYRDACIHMTVIE